MATNAFFAPQLAIPHGVTDISFYIKALGAVELRRFSNDDGSIHVSELSIDGTIFHLHEETKRTNVLCPDTAKSTSVTIGLFVDDVHAVMEQARQAGAIVASEVQDYDYGYRQGDFVDPFGHRWMIEKAI
ncbi:VOC family protein [Mucilaginibacter sp. CAU 1740]|uniref:VOC family protein n=1 Tax=Mucilaginibacter sp. CAU 1740 TaxID=3140365 RepID=UPI00325B148E